jgi:hypothetical protein
MQQDDVAGDRAGGWGGLMVAYHVAVGNFLMRARESNFKNKKNSGSAKSGRAPPDLVPNG